MLSVKSENTLQAVYNTTNTRELEMNNQKVNKYPKHHKPQNKEETKCTDFYIGFWPNEMAFKINKKIKNQRRSTTTNRDPKYKTRMCLWADISNYCPYGRRCTFAHSPSELRRHPKYKTVLCNKFRTLKGCPYGAECDFVHFISESKNHITEDGTRSDVQQRPFRYELTRKIIQWNVAMRKHHQKICGMQ